MSRLGKRLIAAAREARRIARGEANPSQYRVHNRKQRNALPVAAKAKTNGTK
jgi:hypothetical protein